MEIVASTRLYHHYVYAPWDVFRYRQLYADVGSNVLRGDCSQQRRRLG
jgi:hypothetical protein